VKEFETSVLPSRTSPTEIAVKVSKECVVKFDCVKVSETVRRAKSGIVGDVFQNAPNGRSVACPLGRAKLSVWPNQSAIQAVQNDSNGRIRSRLSNY